MLKHEAFAVAEMAGVGEDGFGAKGAKDSVGLGGGGDGQQADTVKVAHRVIQGVQGEAVCGGTVL